MTLNMIVMLLQIGRNTWEADSQPPSFRTDFDHLKSEELIVVNDHVPYEGWRETRLTKKGRELMAKILASGVPFAKVEHCAWCPDPRNPSPEHHPDGCAEHHLLDDVDEEAAWSEVNKWKRHAQDLFASLEAIMEVGKKDMRNEKYEGYFRTARKALQGYEEDIKE